MHVELQLFTASTGGYLHTNDSIEEDSLLCASMGDCACTSDVAAIESPGYVCMCVSVCVCSMYVCMYVCMHACMHVCVYVYVSVCVCMHVCMHVCM